MHLECVPITIILIDFIFEGNGVVSNLCPSIIHVIELTKTKLIQH